MTKHFFFALGLMMMALGVQTVKAVDISTLSGESYTATQDSDPDPESEDDCPPPTNLQVNVTGSTAEITWVAGGTEDRWAIFYMTQSDLEAERPPLTAQTETPSFTLSNLAPNTTYLLMVMPMVLSGDDYVGCAAEGEEVYTAFTTGGTGIEEIVVGRSSLVEGQKILHEGHLYLLRDGKLFNAQGARVK